MEKEEIEDEFRAEPMAAEEVSRLITNWSETENYVYKKIEGKFRMMLTVVKTLSSLCIQIWAMSKEWILHCNIVTVKLIWIHCFKEFKLKLLSARSTFKKEIFTLKNIKKNDEPQSSSSRSGHPTYAEKHYSIKDTLHSRRVAMAELKAKKFHPWEICETRKPFSQ